MPESIVGLLEKADLVVASVSGLADEEALGRIAGAAASLRLRLDYPEDVLIVALAGGTGSGKSSLMNAIVGDDVAQVGGVRPTTDRPLAVAPPSRLDAVSGYLRSLGIEGVSPVDIPDWLCLIDLPDTDSVELDHRLQVDSLLPRIDVVIWVADPEKYRDAALHTGYLAPLAGHADRFVFVLNQVDRLAPAERAGVIADFRSALLADGIEDPVVLATAAGPSAEPPLGMEALLGELGSLRGHAVLTKMLIDLEQACEDLLEKVGRSGLGFRKRSAEVLDTVSKLTVEGEVAAATDELIDFIEELAGAAGEAEGPLRDVSALVPGHLQSIHEELGRPPRRLRPHQSGEQSRLGGEERATWAAKEIERQVMRPLGDILQQRATARAAINDLGLSVATMRDRLSV